MSDFHPFYTIEEVSAIRRQVEALGLETPEGFWRLSLKTLQRYCNGCGADAMPEYQRRVLTAALSMYEAAFFVHDVCYELMTDRAEADKMLLRNMRKIVKYHFGTFWFLKRSAWIERLAVIPPVYGIVALAGGKAHSEAQKDGGA